MIELLFNKLMPIVILIIIGYYWKKKELPFDKDMISSLIMNLGTPALLIASINNKDLTADNMITILIYGTSIIFICTIFTMLYLKLEKKPIRPFLQSFIFPNTGGLGLPIVKKIVDEHNGAIQIENIQPHGAKVTITLPAINAGQVASTMNRLA